MTVILPEDYHAKKALEENHVFCITREQAEKQDIRPLRIGILNIMPRAETYEFNLLLPLGRSLIQIDPVWIMLKNHQYKSSDQDHLKNLYVSFEDAVRDRGFDGLIVTGAPVEELDFEDVTYWNELQKIFSWARENVASTLGICWGGLALARYIGIPKMSYPKKLFGVFEHRNLDRTHRVTGDMDDFFSIPQSRHSGIADHLLEKAGEDGLVNLLAYNSDAGYSIFESRDNRFMMHLGHPEYGTYRLVEEYERDRQKGRKDVAKPANLDVDQPKNLWRAHGNEFFLQWIKDVYIRTPFHI